MTVLQEYNGWDCCATFQLWQKLQPQLKADSAATYEQSKALQGPALYMMLRGILVDVEMTEHLRLQFEAENKALETMLDYITAPLGLGRINIASPTQVVWLFQSLGGKLQSSDREALEQLAKADPPLSPLVNIILAWRDRAKMMTVLAEGITDQDNRMRTFYKVAGTKTWRWSSSKNALWSGMNMQNIKRDEDEDSVGHASIRQAFWADPGYKFINIDLKGADSWAVALEVFKHTGDRAYLNANQSFDIHTYVATLVWPDLGWNGDPSHDRALADQFFYRQYDYRFMCKKGGHGSNYLGGAWALATQMKIPLKVAENFQAAYFKAFPAIRKWHHLRAAELQRTGRLTNLLGHRRNFHGRLDSHDTLKQAIAHLGQSVTASIINKGLLRLWAHIQKENLYDHIQVLAQVHDSVLQQCPGEAVDAHLPNILSSLSVPITVSAPDGSTVTVTLPLEVSVGWNWAAQSPTNPDGLIKLKPGATDARTRQRIPPAAKASQLGKRIRRIHGGSQVKQAVPEMGGDHDDWSLS